MSGRVAAAPAVEPPPAPRAPTHGAHTCQVCGRPGGLGFGGSLLRDRPYRWSCLTHRDQVERMGA